jgi:hypothetical protein
VSFRGFGVVEWIFGWRAGAAGTCHANTFAPLRSRRFLEFDRFGRQVAFARARSWYSSEKKRWDNLPLLSAQRAKVLPTISWVLTGQEARDDASFQFS